MDVCGGEGEGCILNYTEEREKVSREGNLLHLQGVVRFDICLIGKGHSCPCYTHFLGVKVQTTMGNNSIALDTKKPQPFYKS